MTVSDSILFFTFQEIELTTPAMSSIACLLFFLNLYTTLFELQIVSENSSNMLYECALITLYINFNFREQHNTEWVYREVGHTSLVEACERMTHSCRCVLGHDRVQIITGREVPIFILLPYVEVATCENSAF